MPIYDIRCADCGFEGEVLELSASAELKCPVCGKDAEKRMSATSTLTGKGRQSVPGPGDTGCCGSTPGHAGCAGPGSCCGRNQ